MGGETVVAPPEFRNPRHVRDVFSPPTRTNFANFAGVAVFE
jgi:hypothetical protein